VLAPFGIQQRFCFSLCFFQFSFFGSDSVYAFFRFLYFCGLFRHRLRREWHLTVFIRSRNLLRRLNKVSRRMRLLLEIVKCIVFCQLLDVRDKVRFFLVDLFFFHRAVSGRNRVLFRTLVGMHRCRVLLVFFSLVLFGLVLLDCLFSAEDRRDVHVMKPLLLAVPILGTDFRLMMFRHKSWRALLVELRLLSRKARHILGLMAGLREQRFVLRECLRDGSRLVCSGRARFYNARCSAAPGFRGRTSATVLGNRFSRKNDRFVSRRWSVLFAFGPSLRLGAPVKPLMTVAAALPPIFAAVPASTPAPASPPT